MAAGEDQLQALVGDRPVVEVELVHGRRRSLAVQLPRLVLQRPLAADAVDRAVAPGRDQPGQRLLGRAVARPALGGDRERLLRGLLGEIDVAEEADQGGEDAAPLAAEDLLDQ